MLLCFKIYFYLFFKGRMSETMGKKTERVKNEKEREISPAGPILISHICGKAHWLTLFCLSGYASRKLDQRGNIRDTDPHSDAGYWHEKLWPNSLSLMLHMGLSSCYLGHVIFWTCDAGQQWSKWDRNWILLSHIMGLAWLLSWCGIVSFIWHD